MTMAHWLEDLTTTVFDDPLPRREALRRLLGVVASTTLATWLPEQVLAKPGPIPLAHSGTWSLAGDMHTGRQDHTASLLTNGTVLITGGLGVNVNTLASAELYDPNTGTWSPTGSMSTPRVYHTATLLNSGTLLVAGGQSGGNGYLASAELYDPSTGAWSPTGSMGNAREEHTGTLLTNGNVLAAAGYSNTT